MGSGDCMTIVSFLIAMLEIVMETFSTGIDSKSFNFRKVEVEPKDGVPYGHVFFHFVFSMGTMYFGMLLSKWKLHQNYAKVEHRFWLERRHPAWLTARRCLDYIRNGIVYNLSAA
jgi:hypothetical protein